MRARYAAAGSPAGRTPSGAAGERSVAVSNVRDGSVRAGRGERERPEERDGVDVATPLDEAGVASALAHRPRRGRAVESLEGGRSGVCSCLLGSYSSSIVAAGDASEPPGSVARASGRHCGASGPCLRVHAETGSPCRAGCSPSTTGGSDQSRRRYADVSRDSTPPYRTATYPAVARRHRATLRC